MWGKPMSFFFLSACLLVLPAVVAIAQQWRSPRVAHAKSSGEPPRHNVLGTPLQVCCTEPPVGFFRDGFCRTDASDAGLHVVCAVVTDAFLQFTKEQGNDLSTPRGSFAGLKAGDKWCLCASRWKQALQANKAPQVVLASTDQAALQVVALDDLKKHAVTSPDDET